MVKKMSTQVLVLGSGPGGYTAAYRASEIFNEYCSMSTKKYRLC